MESWPKYKYIKQSLFLKPQNEMTCNLVDFHITREKWSLEDKINKIYTCVKCVEGRYEYMKIFAPQGLLKSLIKHSLSLQNLNFNAEFGEIKSVGQTQWAACF